MWYSKKTLGLVGATVLAVSLLASTAAHAEETAPSPSQEVDEEYISTSPSDAQFGYLPGSRSEARSFAQVMSAPFTGYVKAHNAHKSGVQASGHVSWYLTSGTNQKVSLTSTLKARTSWVSFRTMVGPVWYSVYAGGGAGKDAVARYTCRNSNVRDWYTYGQAFAPNAPDPFGSHSSAIQPVACEGGLP